jgi:FtsH-binding integral membrane protein
MGALPVGKDGRLAAISTIKRLEGALRLHNAARSFLFMGLIGIIIASLSISALERALLAHLGARRAHLHRPHRRHAEHQRDVQPDGAGRKAVMGALPLYLDFINLFLMLLRLFGDRRE